jgi:hypothetical protein
MFSSWRVGPRAAAVVLAGLSLAILSTSAQAAKRRVGVSINGMPAGPVREAVSDVLKHKGYEVVAPDLSSDSDDAVAQAARQSKLVAVVIGEVREGGKRLKLRVYGSSGDLISEGSWHEAGGPKKLANAVERTLWSRVGSALAKARPAGGGEKPQRAEREVAQEEAAPRKEKAAPVEETPTYSRSSDSDSQQEKSEESEAPRKRGKKRRGGSDDGAEAVAAKSGGGGGSSGAAGRALDLGVSSRFIMRNLSWAGNTLSSYSLLPPAPALGATVSWYPAAHVMSGWQSNLGLYVGVEYTPGLSSQRKDAMTGAITKFPTQESDYAGGVQGRLVFGPVEGALQLGGGQHGFIFRSGAGADRAMLAALPDVKYTYLRAGLDARIKLPSNFSLQLGGGYRAVLGAGNVNYLLEANAFVPNAKIAGFDGMAAVGYRFLPVLEGRGGFDIRRYAITSSANNMSMTTAGVDQYLAFWVQLAVVLDGSGASAGGSDDEDAEEAPPPKMTKNQREKAADSEDEE